VFAEAVQFDLCAPHSSARRANFLYMSAMPNIIRLPSSEA
jgi:hypothetical protein